jgi:hypothetical protein
MDNSQALLKIRTLLGFSSEEVETPTTEVEVVFESAASDDGTIFSVEGQWEVGKEVVIVLEDGSTPAPSGIFDLDNGFTITIEEGILTELKETEEKEEPNQDDAKEEVEETEEVEATEKKEETMSDDQLVELISKVVKEVKEQMSAELSEVKTLLEEKVEALNNEVETFKKTPSGKKITNSAFESLKDYENSNDIRVNKIKELRKNLNK